MKSKGIIALVFAAILLAIGASIGIADNESSFITANPHVDGTVSLECANSSNNCNGFSAKEYVWLNGASLGHGLNNDGTYFFAVLEPGGQGDPNDGSENNLSDDFDSYANRTFEVLDGALSAYSGTHWLDSGKNESLEGETIPNGLPPYLNLFPYADTPNPGGVYLLAVCSLANGYPVDPNDCKYESFKVTSTTSNDSFFLSGTVFEDMYADGVRDAIDVGLKNQRIAISGIGLDGSAIDAEVKTDVNGYWEFQNQGLLGFGAQILASVDLSLCQESEPGWMRSYPGGDGCHHLSLSSPSLTANPNLNFGSWRPVEITACKEKNNKGEKEPQAGWLVSVTNNEGSIDSQVTDSKGCYTWTGLTPGFTYSVSLDAAPDGQLEEPLVFQFSRAKSGDQLLHTFSTAPEGCTPGFWQSGNAGGSIGGKWLWNTDQDINWVAAGGQNWNPYIWTTPFNSFFPSYAPLGNIDMLTLIENGGGLEDYQQAARDLVAAWLNVSWGMQYPYSTDLLTAMWNYAIETEDFRTLHIILDAANNAHLAGGNCPIDAKNEELGNKTYLPVIIR